MGSWAITRKILCPDEIKIELFHHSSHCHVWREPGSENHLINAIDTVAQSGGEAALCCRDVFPVTETARPFGINPEKSRVKTVFRRLRIPG